MGVDVFVLKMLVEDRRIHGPFGRLLQIGRQGVHVPDDARAVADEVVAKSGLGESLHGLTNGRFWADEGLLPALGARDIVAADASPFEGAALVHDFNDPVAPQWHQQFDTILDGGTLEHVFNVPTALANVMQMLKVGGRLISINAANNQLGHGFYQFSPDLAFRAFSEANGFEMLSLSLVDTHAEPALPAAEDPGRTGVRVEIGRTDAPTYLMFSARKTEHVQPFRRWPQQSDYQSAWTRFAGGAPSAA